MNGNGNTAPDRQNRSDRDLWRMSRDERIRAMWAGELTLAQLCEWSSRRPSEVPRIGTEFAWIAMRTPEWAEAEDRARAGSGAGT